jgi:hypothetical protein
MPTLEVWLVADYRAPRGPVRRISVKQFTKTFYIMAINYTACWRVVVYLLANLLFN